MTKKELQLRIGIVLIVLIAIAYIYTHGHLATPDKPGKVSAMPSDPDSIRLASEQAYRPKSGGIHVMHGSGTTYNAVMMPYRQKRSARRTTTSGASQKIGAAPKMSGEKPDGAT
ncbi:hypothetical protein HY224_00920 [Candidatus Uhrbacteria bacterium]|nr:hypothetical protein [Candidatus Uhrbacteria bacterium]